MTKKQFERLKNHFNKRTFIKIKNERKVMEATLLFVQNDYLAMSIINGEYRGCNEPNAEFRLGIKEIEELYIVPSWFKEGVEVVCTHEYSNKGVVGKIRTSEIHSGGGYIAAWVENISGSFEIAYLKPTDESLIEELFLCYKNELITSY